MRAAHIQAISKFLAARAIALGAKNASVTVIPNGIDITKFSRAFSSEERHTARAHMGVGDDDFCAFTTSRLEYKNGIDTLIKGFAEFCRHNPRLHAKLVIAGTGTLLSALRELSRIERVEDVVIFLGEVLNSALPEYYHAADVFARLSRSEGLGISFLEAMAAGVPMIGTSVGGIPEFLKDGETGLLISPDDPMAFARALQKYYDDKRLSAHVIAHARALASVRYSWDTVARDMNDIFETHLRAGQMMVP